MAYEIPGDLDRWEQQRKDAIRQSQIEEVALRKERLERLESDIKILKEALRFYAEKRNYLADIEDDYGDIASKALERTADDE